jgi:hypothetical protein
VAYGSGTIAMQRLTSVAGNKCTDNPLHGNYVVTVFEREGTEPFNTGFGRAIFHENGDLVFSVSNQLPSSEFDPSVGFGTFEVSGDGEFSFSAINDPALEDDEDDPSLVTASGTFNEDALIATFFTDDGWSGQVFFYPLQSFQRGLSLSILAGKYDILIVHEDDLVAATATVKSNGKFSTKDDDGCTIDGEFAIPGVNFNQATLVVEVSGCGEDQTLDGSAMYNYSDDSIFAVVHDEEGATALRFERK